MIEIYEKIIEYVDEHIHEEIKVSDLLKKIGYSRRHIYKMFQDHNDLPIMEYIRNKKMYAASVELLSERNMYDIALDYGYDTPAGFYKAFKGVFGCSPSEYKNNMLRGRGVNNKNIKSIEELTKEIELDIDNAELYFQRGQSYLKSGQRKKAIEDYNKALDLGLKNKVVVYREMINTYFFLGKEDKIIENCTKAIEIDPTVANDYLMRGQMYMRNNEYAKAIEDFNKGLELDPKVSWAYSYRGACYFKSGESDKGTADLEKAIEISTDLSYTYFLLGSLYEHDFMQKEAIEYYTKSIEIDPMASGWTYLNRADLYKELKQYGKAAEDYEMAIKVSPHPDELIYPNYFQLCKELNQYEKAIEILNKIIELDSKAEWAYIERDVLYEKLGEYSSVYLL